MVFRDLDYTADGGVLLRCQLRRARPCCGQTTTITNTIYDASEGL